MCFTREKDAINNHHAKNQTSSIQLQRTCAIVGNSGILLNSSCREQINQNDMVIRSNLPIVKGFESDVGDRTSITSMNLVTLKKVVKEFNHSKSDRGHDSTRIQRLKHLNNTLVWFPLDLTVEAKQLLTTLARYCEENGISVQFAYSLNPIRPVTRR